MYPFSLDPLSDPLAPRILIWLFVALVILFAVCVVAAVRSGV